MANGRRLVISKQSWAKWTIRWVQDAHGTAPLLFLSPAVAMGQAKLTEPICWVDTSSTLFVLSTSQTLKFWTLNHNELDQAMNENYFLYKTMNWRY